MSKQIIRLRAERLKRGWTLEFVGTKIGIKKTTVYQIETGKRKPSYEVLCQLENLFKLPHRQLFAVIDDANSSQENNITN